MMVPERRTYEVLCCAILMLLVLKTKGQVQTTTTCAQLTKIGQSFNIRCTYSTTPVNGIRWRRSDGISVVTCVTGSGCFPNLGYSVISEASVNTLTIESSRVVDEGIWTCHDNDLTKATTNCNLTVEAQAQEAKLIVDQPTKLERGSTFKVEVEIFEFYCTGGSTFNLDFSDSSSHQIRIINQTSDTPRNGTGDVTIKDMKNQMCGKIKLQQTCGGSIGTVPGNDDLTLKIYSICRPVSMGSLIVSILLLVFGGVAMIAVYFGGNQKLEKLRKPSFIIGIIWFGFAIAGIVATVLVCNPLEPIQEVPCNGEYFQDLVIPALFFTVLMLVSGVVLFFLPFFACKPQGCMFLKIGSSDGNGESPERAPSSQPRVSETVNSSSQGRHPTTGRGNRLQPITSPRNLPNNASAEESTNSQRSDVTSASKIKPDFPDTTGEGDHQTKTPPKKKKSTKKKKKKQTSDDTGIGSQTNDQMTPVGNNAEADSGN